MTMPRFFSVVPAAGQSTRMGCNKLALKTNALTILEHVILALIQGGVDHVVVVVRTDADELSLLARRAGAEVCQLVASTPSMRASVEHGLNWIEQQFRPRSEDAWFLMPADHPAIDSNVVRRL